MAGKRNVSDLLDGTGKRTPIRRGRGFQLSTETASEEQPATQEVSLDTSRNREIKPEKPRRIKRGYELREDLVKAFKVTAAEEGRKIYEVMEEALEQYLERRKQGTT